MRRRRLLGRPDESERVNMHKMMELSRDGTRFTVSCECGWAEGVTAPYGDVMAKDGTPKPATAKDKAKKQYAEHVRVAPKPKEVAVVDSTKALHDRAHNDNRYARELMPRVRAEIKAGEWQSAADIANELSALFTTMSDYIEEALYAKGKGE